MEFLSAPWWSALLAIILIDLVLAGDNAIVIALAARNLPKERQKQAIVWGTVGAIVVRTLMTLIGIICCNMLLITTFGLQDSMSYFVGRYYQGTIAYDLRADLSGQGGTLASYRKRLDAARVDGLMEKGVSIMGAASDSACTQATALSPSPKSKPK